MTMLTFIVVLFAGGVNIKRRTVTSNKTARKVKSDGGKIKLQWSDFHTGPHTNENRSLLVRDIGAAVKTYVPMLASTFYKLQPHQRDAVEKYLLVCLILFSNF